MKININDCISGFTLINREEIDDINSEGYLFLHKKSGARLMYIENDDDNKVFFISFKNNIYFCNTSSLNSELIFHKLFYAVPRNIR